MKSSNFKTITQNLKVPAELFEATPNEQGKTEDIFGLDAVVTELQKNVDSKLESLSLVGIWSSFQIEDLPYLVHRKLVVPILCLENGDLMVFEDSIRIINCSDIRKYLEAKMVEISQIISSDLNKTVTYEKLERVLRLMSITEYQLIVEKAGKSDPFKLEFNAEVVIQEVYRLLSLYPTQTDAGDLATSTFLDVNTPENGIGEVMWRANES